MTKKYEVIATLSGSRDGFSFTKSMRYFSSHVGSDLKAMAELSKGLRTDDVSAADYSAIRLRTSEERRKMN